MTRFLPLVLIPAALLSGCAAPTVSQQALRAAADMCAAGEPYSCQVVPAYLDAVQREEQRQRSVATAMLFPALLATGALMVATAPTYYRYPTVIIRR